MLRRVALVRTDVSEELSASFIRVTRIGELETTLAVTSNWGTLRRNTWYWYYWYYWYWYWCHTNVGGQKWDVMTRIPVTGGTRGANFVVHSSMLRCWQNVCSWLTCEQIGLLSVSQEELIFTDVHWSFHEIMQKPFQLQSNAQGDVHVSTEHRNSPDTEVCTFPQDIKVENALDFYCGNRRKLFATVL
jgi:hypothetical protein